MRVLCIHGINTDEDPAVDNWLANWRAVIEQELGNLAPHDVKSFHYNNQFNALPTTFADKMKAIALAAKAAIGQVFSRDYQPDAAGVNPGTVAMVAKWIVHGELRASLRAALSKAIKEFEPDLVLAHSLGTLILYDALLRDSAMGHGRVLITFGSQIARPELSDVFGNHLRFVSGLRHWFHLRNPRDLILASYPLPFSDDTFTQVETAFLHQYINHDASMYLSHAATEAQVWSTMSVRSASRSQQRKVGSKLMLALPRRPVRPLARRRRALLVGINDYPQKQDRLSGCVNDVFSMSAMLQDQGWDGDSIRVVLDDRATTAGVMERLHWLLGDVRAGEERVFYYSGHGAKLTQYNAEGEPDHHDEALVTWDFDWKKNCGITDDMLVSLYANLPYEAHVVFLLDCCHSGGMARSGSNPARGIDPPDDVAHRALRWDSTSQLWVRRNLDLSSKIRASDTGKAASFIGQDRATHRIGRAVSLWQQDPEATADEARRLGHAGPFNPTILASCAEGEYAYEYRHGVESHGAFTFVLTRMLTGKGAPPSLKTLVERAAKVMKVRLELQQHPALYNPGKAPNPFKPGGVERRPRRGT